MKNGCAEYVEAIALGAALTAMSMSISGCGKPGAQAGPPSAPTTAASLEVRIVRPRRGEIGRRVTLPGIVRANQQVALYAKTAGYLKTVSVDRGDRVRSGQRLAEIEAPELIADLDKQKAEVSVAETAHKRLNDALSRSPNLVTPQAVDDARGRYEIARANLHRTETLLSYTHISAPFAGIVIKRGVDPGAFIPAATSGSVAQSAVLLTIADLGRVRIEVPIPEQEVPLIKVGLPTKVTVEELPGRTWDGKVTRFGYVLDEATRTMPVEIEISNPKEELRPGMYASVHVTIERKADALVIPVEALVLEKSKSFAFTVVGDRARRVPIKIGFRDANAVEILEGLQVGQAVILAGRLAITDGQAVTTVEAR